MEKANKSAHEWSVVWRGEKNGHQRRQWHGCATLKEAVDYREWREAQGQPTIGIERRIGGQWVPVDPTTGEPAYVAAEGPAGQPDMGAVHSFLAVRDRVLERDGYRCRDCAGPSVTVKYLPGVDDSRLDADGLVTVCGDCTFTTPGRRPGNYQLPPPPEGEIDAHHRRPDGERDSAAPGTLDERPGSARPGRPDMERPDGPDRPRRRGSRGRGGRPRPDLTRQAA